MQPTGACPVWPNSVQPKATQLRRLGLMHLGLRTDVTRWPGRKFLHRLVGLANLLGSQVREVGMAAREWWTFMRICEFSVPPDRSEYPMVRQRAPNRKSPTAVPPVRSKPG